jgi:hypothetical protein
MRMTSPFNIGFRRISNTRLANSDGPPSRYRNAIGHQKRKQTNRKAPHLGEGHDRGELLSRGLWKTLQHRGGKRSRRDSDYADSQRRKLARQRQRHCDHAT